MLNFLPNKTAAAVRRRYAARLAGAFALALGAGAATYGVALVPAIVEGRRAVESLSARADALRASAETKEYGLAAREAAALRRDVAAAAVSLNPAISSAVDGVIRAVPGDVSIASFSFSRVGTSTVQAKIEGVAKTRDALLLFRANLERAAGVSDVDVPVSSLARETDAAFSVTATVDANAS